MDGSNYISVSQQLDEKGLLWQPEIGDEVVDRNNLKTVSILVDPCGLTPTELRGSYVWLPSMEQLVHQFEARQALIYHAGITEMFSYQVVVRTPANSVIETAANNLRVAMGSALYELLINLEQKSFH